MLCTLGDPVNAWTQLTLSAGVGNCRQPFTNVLNGEVDTYKHADNDQIINNGGSCSFKRV